MTEREIFEHAQQISDLEQRAAYVQDVCGDDHPLAQKVTDLLAASAAAGSFLESPAGMRSNLSGTEIWPEERSPAARLGVKVGDIVAEKYKLLQMIGEGGMGVVFMAEQRQPIVRRVALKIVKPGLHSTEILARFEAEQQALAVMEHPYIAKVFDAGATDAGLPYFVMELVHGIPITRYCDEAHVNVSERLALFVPVCQAVQHAHQKGIIHRDIKPSNVLVALFDGKPVPKVIDFGVAKAIGQPLTDKTLFTRFGSIVGTLEYMSPEQATLNALDVDTRSDIYSLGVLLYELLTGETPMDRQLLRSAAFDEVLRVIRVEEPPKPSTRLSSSERLPAIAAERRIEPRRLTAQVRGDLDWVVMKALAKERDRRYDTAKDLAEDVERHLACQPVFAGPPSIRYRLGKLARRHRGSLLAAASVAAVLISATVVASRLSDHTKRLQVQVAAETILTGEAKKETKRTRSLAKQQQIIAANLGAMSDPNAEGFAEATLEVVEAANPGGAGRVISQAMSLGIEGAQLVESGKPAEALAKLDQGAAILKEIPQAQSAPDGGALSVANMAIVLVNSGRGQSLDFLHRSDEADEAWSEAIAAAPAQIRADVQSERLLSLLRTGDLTKAVATADRWTSESDSTATLLSAAAARVYAQAAAASTDDDEAKTLRMRAIFLLQQVEKQGYFTVDWRREDLADAADWISLRDSSEFQQLLSQVAASPPEKPFQLGEVASAFNMIFAATNADGPAESAELLAQATATLESTFPQRDEQMLLYIKACRELTAAITLGEQGRTEEAASKLDSADDILSRLLTMAPSSNFPASNFDVLRNLVDATRKAQLAPHGKNRDR